MKQYPSIPNSSSGRLIEFDAFVFDKLDGSNLRFEWDRKQGWYKYGTRTQMLETSHPVLGEAIGLFLERLSDPLAQLAERQKWVGLTVFVEFWGANSFAGRHEPSDPKFLSLLDLSPYKRGLVRPPDLLEWCANLELPRFLGEMRWSRELIEEVRQGKLEGVTFEGIVGKALEGTPRRMGKAKTQNWIDQVLELYGPERGKALIES